MERAHQLSKVIKTIGEPSWWILGVLPIDPGEAILGKVVIERVLDILKEADYPIREISKITVSRALFRMEVDGLIDSGTAQVEVPAGRGLVRLEYSPTFHLTTLGLESLATRMRLNKVWGAHNALAALTAKPAQPDQPKTFFDSFVKVFPLKSA